MADLDGSGCRPCNWIRLQHVCKFDGLNRHISKFTGISNHCSFLPSYLCDVVERLACSDIEWSSLWWYSVRHIKVASQAQNLISEI